MINYPVSPESRWAMWSISQAEILKHNKPWPRRDGMEIVGLDPDMVPLLEVQSPQPAYDPATEKLERSTTVDVDANTHTHGWNIVALTQAELDAIAAQAANDAEREQAKAVYQDLMNSTGNSTQRIVRVERVCAYLLKDLFGAN